MKHTKEPWHFEHPLTRDMLTEEDWSEYIAGNPPITRIVNEKEEIVVTAHDLFTFKNGNAQRIVECVNALAGVADPASAIAAARDTLNYLIGYMDETEHATGVVMQCGIEHARAALALLEGVQP